jgi:hypothetical protein
VTMKSPIEPRPSPARPWQRPGNIDDVIARGSGVLFVPGNSKPHPEIDPPHIPELEGTVGKIANHSGAKPMPSPAETSDSSEYHLVPKT